jgi:hypothetical protein
MSEGRQSERLKGRVPVNYSDTRKINSPNRYSILDPDPDDDSVEEETIEFVTNKGDDDDDSNGSEETVNTEDWFVIDNTMSDNKKSHKVDLRLTEREMLPIEAPELWEVYQFTRLLANKAANVGLKRSPPGGYADLVESEASYKERTGSEFKGMPTTPTKPDIPKAGTSNQEFQVELVVYKSKNEKYEEYLAVIAALKLAIQQKFPLLAQCFESSRFGSLPADKTPREILKIMGEHTITDQTEKDRLAIEIGQKMQALAYKPNKMGAIAYLNNMRELRILANEVKDADEIPEERLMTLAIMAFEDCGHEKTQISLINTEWTQTKALLTPDVLLEKFVTFWCQKLKTLYRQVGETTHKAHLVQPEDIRSVYTHMDAQDEERTQELQALQAKIVALEAAIARKDVPSVVTAPTVSSSSHSGGNSGEQVVAMLASALAGLQSTTSAPPAPTGRQQPHQNRSSGNRWAGKQLEWRKVDKWCWQCSHNTSHNSDRCRAKDTQAHLHPNATREKPEGGNMSKKDNWGWYYHPRRGYRETKPSD